MKILICFLFVLMSCSPSVKKGKTKIKFKLPVSNSRLNIASANTATSSYGLTDITTLDEIDCYAVLIGTPSSSGICYDTAGVEVMRADELYGFFPSGSTIELEVNAGFSRTINLVGLKTNLTTCPSTDNMEESQSSMPLLVGSKTTDLPDGAEVSVVIDISMIGSKGLNRCENPPFNSGPQTSAIWDSDLWDQASWQ